MTVRELLASLEASARTWTGRRLLGIAGAPGAGKSTLADRLVRDWNRRAGSGAVRAAYVPMDGFHLANAELARLGRADRKGAPDTFDAAGFLALLERLRRSDDQTVWAPAFERSLEEPIAGAIAVEPVVGLVVTEGNYLLLAEPPWGGVRDLLDDAWFLDVPSELRLERLVARHVAFGRTPEEARRWVARSDEPNARRVEAARGRADRVIVLVDEDVAGG